MLAKLAVRQKYKIKKHVALSVSDQESHYDTTKAPPPDTKVNCYSHCCLSDRKGTGLEKSNARANPRNYNLKQQCVTVFIKGIRNDTYKISFKLKVP